MPLYAPSNQASDTLPPNQAMERTRGGTVLPTTGVGGRGPLIAHRWAAGGDA